MLTISNQKMKFNFEGSKGNENTEYYTKLQMLQKQVAP